MVLIWKVLVLTVIGGFGFTGNSLAILTLLKNPSVITDSSRNFILNQSLLDVIAAVMLLLSEVNIRAAGINIFYQSNWQYDLLCKTWSTGGFLWGFMTASTYSLVFLTLDRYLRIMHPFWCRKYYSSWLTRIFLGLPWIFGPAFQIGMQISASKVIDGECVMVMIFDTWGKIMALMICAVEFYVPLVAISACYVGIIFKLRKRNASMEKYTRNAGGSRKLQGLRTLSGPSVEDKAQTCEVTNEKNVTTQSDFISTQGVLSATDVTNISHVSSECNSISTSMAGVTAPHKIEVSTQTASSSSTTAEKQAGKSANQTNQAEKKVTVMLAAVCSGFILCYITSQAMFLLEIAGLISVNFTVLDVAQILGFANCAINPIIYVLMHAKLRAAFVSICCRCRSSG